MNSAPLPSIRSPEFAARICMHELSIAMSMIEMAEEEAERRGGVRVHAVHLRLGGLSGVVKEALCFSYAVACEGTRLEGSQLVIEDVPIVVYCAACEAESTLASPRLFACAICQAPTSQIVQGKELEVTALEIE